MPKVVDTIYTRVIKCKLMYETKEKYDTVALESELKRRGIELVLVEDDYMPILRIGAMPKRRK